MGKRKINWTEVETRYVTGNESYTQLGKIFKVSTMQVSRYGKAFGWYKKRSQYREGLKARLAEQTQKATVLEKTRFDELAQHSCDVVISLMAKTMADAYEAKELSTKTAIDTMSAVRSALDVKYRILGIPDKHEFKGDVKTITELSVNAQAMVDKVMGTPETRAAMAMALVPLKQGGEVHAGGNGKSSGSGSDGADGSDSSDD